MPHDQEHALDSAADHTGTINDTQHGTRGGGTLHSAAGGGSAGFMTDAQVTKLAGISAGAALLQDYQFGESTKVPGGGTLQLKGPGNTAVGLRMNRAGTITGASIQVDVADGAQAYDLHVYKNGVSAATVNMAVGALGASSAALAVAVAIGDLLTVWLIRVGAGGASLFTSEHAMVEVKF